jgi:CubicO group peptidase (beta-lactamase class C family)
LALRAFADEPSCAPPTAIADGWETSAPDASGFDTAVLCAVLAGVANGREDIHGVIIERHGRLVAELYRSAQDHPVSTLYGLWNPFGGTVVFGPTTLHDVRPVTKSIVSLLVGIALERGKIANITTPVLDFYPDLADLRSPQRNAITLAHLLTMRLQWDENGFDETRLYWKSNPSRFLLSRPVVAEPGTTFRWGLAVEDRLKRLGEQLLPLLDRANEMMIRNLKAVRELGLGPHAHRGDQSGRAGQCG